MTQPLPHTMPQEIAIALRRSPLFANAGLLRLYVWIVANVPSESTTATVKVGRGKKTVELAAGEMIVSRSELAKSLHEKPSNTYLWLKKLEAIGAVQLEKIGNATKVVLLGFCPSWQPKPKSLTTQTTTQPESHQQLTTRENKTVSSPNQDNQQPKPVFTHQSGGVSSPNQTSLAAQTGTQPQGQQGVTETKNGAVSSPNQTSLAAQTKNGGVSSPNQPALAAQKSRNPLENKGFAGTGNQAVSSPNQPALAAQTDSHYYDYYNSLSKEEDNNNQKSNRADSNSRGVVPPPLDELRAFAAERVRLGRPAIDPVRFQNYYACRKWVGQFGKPIDWQARWVDIWEANKQQELDNQKALCGAASRPHADVRPADPSGVVAAIHAKARATEEAVRR